MVENMMKCYRDDSLSKVLDNINENCKGVCFAVAENDKLIGVLTDGDIRRALLNNISLHATVSQIIDSEKKFVFGRDDESAEEMMRKINDQIRIVPIVNGNMELVDYFTFNHSVHFPVAIPNLSGNEFKYLTDAFFSTWISSQGEYLDRFESDFSAYCDCEFGVAVSNGTVALHLALLALGIGHGDEVIVPDLTFAATINAVLHAGAIPVIVDLDEDSWCIDPDEIEAAIGPRTKAVIPVHIYGQPCDMDAIMEIAAREGLKVIEDCAEAHGATYKGKKVGSFGDIGCFSFFGNKVITTGEGGMCVTNSKAAQERMVLFKNHGMSKERKYWHDVVGYNFRLTNLQAAVGLAQLERIDDIHTSRATYERKYREILTESGFTFQEDLSDRGRITWLASVLVDKQIGRNRFIDILVKEGLDARPFFCPLSDMPVYQAYSRKDNKIAKRISANGVNLPTYESLKSIGEIERILTKIVKFGL